MTSSIKNWKDSIAEYKIHISKTNETKKLLRIKGTDSWPFLSLSISIEIKNQLS